MRISTRNASSDAISVGMVRMKRPSRNRGECAGLWKCAAMARMVQISARKAATGWITRIEDSELRVPSGSEKSSLEMPLMSSVKSCQCPFRSIIALPAHTRVITNLDTTASVAFAVSPNSKCVSIVTRDRNGLDYGCRKRRKKEQCKRSEKENCQRCRRSHPHRACERARGAARMLIDVHLLCLTTTIKQGSRRISKVEIGQRRFGSSERATARDPEDWRSRLRRRPQRLLYHQSTQRAHLPAIPLFNYLLRTASVVFERAASRSAPAVVT